MAENTLANDPLRRITLTVASTIIGLLLAWVFTTAQQAAVDVGKLGVQVKNLEQDQEKMDRRLDRIERPPTPGVR